MNFKEIQDLIKLINKSNLSEFKMKEGEFELSIRTDKYQRIRTQPGQPQPAPVIPVASSPIPIQPAYQASPAPEKAPEAPKAREAAPAKAESDDAHYIEVKSPMVGTFYRSGSPEKPPFVKVGDTIEPGQVICIVEAMKLFNDIESEVSGKIVKVVVEDAAPVEYDQVLFLVDPKG